MVWLRVALKAAELADWKVEMMERKGFEWAA
jgi:hypothetical protein